MLVDSNYEISRVSSEQKVDRPETVITILCPKNIVGVGQITGDKRQTRHPHEQSMSLWMIEPAERICHHFQKFLVIFDPDEKV